MLINGSIKVNYLLLFFFFLPKLHAQNLIPNPDFEQHEKCPPYIQGYRYISKWDNPNSATPDYFCNCANKKEKIEFIKPKSGECCVGIGFYSSPKAWEYIQCKLTSKLEKEKKYQFTIHLRTSFGYYLDEAQVLFSSNKVHSNKWECISSDNFLPLINNVKSSDPNGWIKISVVYLSKGGEQFLTIGNFDPDASYSYSPYFYIDDLSLLLIENEAPIEPKESPKKDSVFAVIKDTPKNELSPIIGKPVTLKNIFFAVDKSELLPKSFNELNKLVNYMNENPQTSITILGHTDNTGSEDHNQKLSQSRAKSVADFLAAKGVAESRIIYKGYGSKKPIASNETEDGKQQNRRVEIIINKL